MPTVLVSGAASGLGHAYVKAYSALDNYRIIAVDRIPCPGTRSNVQHFIADLSSQQSIDALTISLREYPIDLLIHSAGIRGLVPQQEREHPGNVAACETMDVMDLDTMTRAFQINAAGTFMFLRALLPNLRKGCNPKVVVMSSRMGSVGNNEHPNKDAGSAYAYRASKAALNMIVRSFAADVPQIVFVLNHPGRVETALVKCKEEGAITPEESVDGIIPLIQRWDNNDSGKFYDRFGEVIPW